MKIQDELREIEMFDEAGIINYDIIQRAIKRIEELETALLPFSNMHRFECDLNELACQRGVASDKTILTNKDFAQAFRALNPIEDII